MASRYSIILSFILTTLLVTGSVELLYSSLGKVLTESNITHKGQKTQPTPGRNKMEQKQAMQTGKAAPHKDYTNITKRNLFGKTASTTTAPTTKPQAILTTTSLDLTLLGTIGGKTDDQRAIIRRKKSGKGDIYSTGDSIEQAQIKQINRSQIILTVNGTDEVLLMEEMKSPPSAKAKKRYPMPVGATQPNKRVAKDDTDTDDTVDTQEDAETTEQSTPTTIPKRRMTLKPKNQQVVE